GAEISLARLGHGACVGEVALLTGSCRTASVRAAGKVCAVGFSAKDISGILDSYPKVREILHNLVQERAEDAIEKLFRGR
ncbi:MAG: cyclic nucleotide-binding domain-containing protein, partial [Myxococcota bacterium]